MTAPALAVLDGRLFTDVVDVTSDLVRPRRPGHLGRGAAVRGPPVCARFARVRPAVPWPGAPWVGPALEAWTSSLDRSAFSAGVTAIREAIAAGDVYQVNLTRRLSAPLPAARMSPRSAPRWPT